MKVLHVTPSYYPAFVYGGPIRTTHQLNLALAEQGVSVRVLTTDAHGETVLSESGNTVTYAPGLSVHYAPRSFGPDVSLRLLWGLPAAIRWADVVHLTAVYSFTTLPTLWWCRFLKKPVFWSPRGALQEWHGSPRRALKSMWDTAARVPAGARVTIVAASEREEAAARERFPNVRVIRLENGVTVPAEVRRQPGEERTVLFLGRLHPIKGIENLIEATARLPGTKLVVAGPSPGEYLQRLKQKAKEQGVAEKVSFAGEVDEQQKAQLFAEATVLALPSFSENFGMVVAEALAHGVPAVASRNTPWSALEEKGCGRWVENDPASLAEAIGDVLRSDTMAMGGRGRVWMQEEFSWKEKAARLCDYYRSACPKA